MKGAAARGSLLLRISNYSTAQYQSILRTEVSKAERRSGIPSRFSVHQQARVS